VKGSTRVLVTGGAGFIGSHLVDHLLDEGYEVAIYDNLEPQVHGPERKLPIWTKVQKNKLKGFFLSDIRDQSDLSEALHDFRPHVVVHLAARVGVGQAETAPVEYVDCNTLGTTRLFEAILDHNNDVRPEDACYRVVVAGSMSAYGEGMYACAEHGLVRAERFPDRLLEGHWGASCTIHDCQMPHGPDGEGLRPMPIQEFFSLRPKGIYAATKAQQEDLALLFAKNRGISVAVPRFFNVLGPRQSLNNPYTGVAAIFAARAIKGLPLRVYEDGWQARDFIAVSDVVAALRVLIGSWQLSSAKRFWASPTSQGSFNISTGIPTTILELAEMINARLNGGGIEVTKTYRTGDIRCCIGDPRKMMDLGWQPKVQLEEIVAQVCAQAAKESITAELDIAHKELEASGLLFATKAPAEGQKPSADGSVSSENANDERPSSEPGTVWE
jgi:dTDP-L-rhamnose 4-epimerase